MQDANSLEIQDPQESGQTGQSGDDHTIEMSSLIRVDGCSHERHHHFHYHWDNEYVANELNKNSHARCNDDMERITNHRNHNTKAGNPEVPKVRFGSVDLVDYIPTKNRHDMLSDSVGCYEHSIGMSTLERISESKNMSVGAVTSHMRVYDKTGKYVKLTCTSDSGAGESVLPCDSFPEIGAERSEESSTTYASANGSILPNKGRKSLNGFTDGQAHAYELAACGRDPAPGKYREADGQGSQGCVQQLGRWRRLCPT